MKLQRQLQQMKFKVLCASTLAIEESTTTKHLLQSRLIVFSNKTPMPMKTVGNRLNRVPLDHVGVIVEPQNTHA